MEPLLPIPAKSNLGVVDKRLMSHYSPFHFFLRLPAGCGSLTNPQWRLKPDRLWMLVPFPLYLWIYIY